MQSFGVCKGNKPSTLHRAQGDGALGLRSQQDSDIDDDASVAQAEETEKQVQQIVLGSLAALVTLGIGGYCVYSGQNPIEVRGLPHIAPIVYSPYGTRLSWVGRRH